MSAEIVLLGEVFASSREKGKAGLPLLSVTLNNGLVIRDSLDRRTETNLSADDHLLVKKGDIAYNMMRVWQGALGRAEFDGLVSPAYVVLRPSTKIDSLYAEYLFKTPRMIYMFWAYSYGLTKDRLRLYYKDFKRISIKIPPVVQQKAMAKSLSLWDKAFTNIEKLLENSLQQKKLLLRELVTCRKRLSGCDELWSDFYFSDVVSLSKEKFNPKVENDIQSCVELEHITQVTSELIGLTTTHEAVSTKTVFKKGSVLFGKLRPYLRKYWLADQAGVCSTEIWVFNANLEECIPEYIHQLVQTDFFIDASNVSSGTHMPRADWNVVKDLVVSLPPISEQKKIAEILTVADQEIQTLQQKLIHLKQEKKALMQQLLTGKKRVKLDNATIPTTP